jgi:methyl-accepting chemotaxis protein
MSSPIVRQLIIVALNASIEAARAGAMGRGFAVVAEEMRSLSVSAEKLAQDFRSGLYENDLITTTTFQDMQAGGKMVVGALTGLELQTRRMLGQLQEGSRAHDQRAPATASTRW